jgi:hypothetical protein
MEDSLSGSFESEFFATDPMRAISLPRRADGARSSGVSAARSSGKAASLALDRVQKYLKPAGAAKPAATVSTARPSATQLTKSDSMDLERELEALTGGGGAARRAVYVPTTARPAPQVELSESLMSSAELAPAAARRPVAYQPSARRDELDESFLSADLAPAPRAADLSPPGPTAASAPHARRSAFAPTVDDTGAEILVFDEPSDAEPYTPVAAPAPVPAPAPAPGPAGSARQGYPAPQAAAGTAGPARRVAVESDVESVVDWGEISAPVMQQQQPAAAGPGFGPHGTHAIQPQQPPQHQEQPYAAQYSATSQPVFSAQLQQPAVPTISTLTVPQAAPSQTQSQQHPPFTQQQPSYVPPPSSSFTPTARDARHEPAPVTVPESPSADIITEEYPEDFEEIASSIHLTRPHTAQKDDPHAVAGVAPTPVAARPATSPRRPSVVGFGHRAPSPRGPVRPAAERRDIGVQAGNNDIGVQTDVVSSRLSFVDSYAPAPSSFLSPAPWPQLQPQPVYAWGPSPAVATPAFASAAAPAAGQPAMGTAAAAGAASAQIAQILASLQASLPAGR